VIIYDAARWVDSTSLSRVIREGTYYFAVIECFHVLSLTIVMGAIAAVDLRLLGISARNIPVRKYCSQLLPVTWTAFLISVVTGTLLFISNSSHYIADFPFQMKMLLMALAGMNMLVFHRFIWETVDQWGNRISPPPAARIAGGLSLSLWLCVIFFGRWIGFSVGVS